MDVSLEAPAVECGRAIAAVPRWSDLCSGIRSWAKLRQRLPVPLEFPPVEMCLVRHGETTTNAAGLVTGEVDAPLTERGREQARAAGRSLAGDVFEVAWSSTLRRSIETLDLILQTPGVVVGSVERDSRLNERALGDMELTQTRPVDAYARGDLEFAPPGGESYLSVAHRSLSFLLDVADLATRCGQPIRVLVSTHVGPMRILAGIIEEREDAADVLALYYENSVPVRFTMSHLVFPRFV